MSTDSPQDGLKFQAHYNKKKRLQKFPLDVLEIIRINASADNPRTVRRTKRLRLPEILWTFPRTVHRTIRGRSKTAIKKEPPCLELTERPFCLIEVQMRCYSFLLMKSSQSSILYAFSKTSFGDHDT